MMRITTTEFTRAPGLHLETAARGEPVLLIRYGRPYVLLSPPPPPEEEELPAEEAR